MQAQIMSPAAQPAGEGDARLRLARTASALRRASGFAIFAGGVLVLAGRAVARLHGV